MSKLQANYYLGTSFFNPVYIFIEKGIPKIVFDIE